MTDILCGHEKYGVYISLGVTFSAVLFNKRRPNERLQTLH